MIISGLFLSLLLFLNRHLLGFSFPDEFIFYPEKFFGGEFTRILSYAFVHVSWYHLILDAGAFIFLVQALPTKSFLKKTFYVSACIFGSAALACFYPSIGSTGLCGLSGAAHGLFVICALQYLTCRPTRNVGFVLALVIVFKCAYELWTGNMLMEGWHMGNIGIPVSYSHAGGLLAGIFAFFIIYITENLRIRKCSLFAAKGIF